MKRGSGTIHGGHPTCRGSGSEYGARKVTVTLSAPGGDKKVGGTPPASRAQTHALAHTLIGVRHVYHQYGLLRVA